MSRSFGRLAVTFLAFSFAVPSSLAQKTKSNDQDPMSKPRNEKVELKKAYKDWLEKDVAYIITDEERKAFRKLATDDERERFIEEFWRRRDPDPDTDENEYREEYYERIAYANEHYASGVPGWKTDRGRIYIQWGKPDEVESHPSGGTYNRESYEGGGSTSTYPFERWFYRYLPGVGSGIEIEFVDPTGSGEYRIARNPDEKDALLHIPGAGLTLAEEMGLSDKSDRVANFGGIGMPGYQREQDSPFSRLQILTDLQRPPQIKFNDLASITSQPIVEDNPLNFDVRVDYFRQSDERVITAFTIQTDNSNLSFKDSGGVQQAQLNIFGRITHVSGRRAGVFEDPVITRATVDELTETKSLKSAYQKAVALPPGNYKLDVVVRDTESGATGVRHVPVVVPKYETGKLSTSTLVLATKLESLGDQPAVGMFTIGNVKVIPNVSGTFHRGSPVGVYMQIYNAGIDQTTLRPSVDVEYALMKDGKELGKQAEDWRGNSDAGQRLTLTRLIDSRQLVPGDYTLEVRVRDHVSGQSLKQEAKFSVLQ
ncbi:MAG TPA: GWxTD domain-containing protein [Pyrinomonadaceae bacterium]|nr:GWxTD domain-containing protein [Pyrinomonadaceae bacterium]